MEAQTMDHQTPYYPPIRPFAAAAAMFRLMRNPQDTRQVFLLTEALRGRSMASVLERFRNSPVGARILAEQRSLVTILSDQARLAAMKPGSFGRTYYEFMAEEDLSAQGLVELGADNAISLHRSSQDAQIFGARMRDMHDLYHVLCGYGRDEVGEICVLAFSYPQQKIRSFAVISRGGMYRIARMVSKLGGSGKMVRHAVQEAARHGKQAAWLPGEELESMLEDDLAAVRARLNIPAPTIYRQLITEIRAKTGRPTGPLVLNTH